MEIRDEYGFTIIESTLIFLIIGLMAVIALPRILSMDRNVVYASSRQVTADMRYARSLAITEVAEHFVLFSVDPLDSSRYNKYEIFRGDGGESVGDAVKSMDIPEKVVCSPAGGFDGKNDP